MEWQLNQRWILLSKIRWALANYSINAQLMNDALSTLRFHINIFAGLDEDIKIEWINKLAALKNLDKKNRILALECILLLGRDFLHPKDMRLLNALKLETVVDHIDLELLQRYLLDRKKKIRAKMIEFLLSSRGSRLGLGISAARKHYSSSFNDYQFNNLIQKKLRHTQLTREAKLMLLPAVKHRKLEIIWRLDNFMKKEKDPLLNYMMLALMLEEGPHRYLRTYPHEQDRSPLLKEMKSEIIKLSKSQKNSSSWPGQLLKKLMDSFQGSGKG